MVISVILIFICESNIMTSSSALFSLFFHSFFFSFLTQNIQKLYVCWNLLIAFFSRILVKFFSFRQLVRILQCLHFFIKNTIFSIFRISRISRFAIQKILLMNKKNVGKIRAFLSYKSVEIANKRFFSYPENTQDFNNLRRSA